MRRNIYLFVIMATNMYYSSESSDSENAVDSFTLDLSYLMLDADSLAVHLKNSVREQQVQQKDVQRTERLKQNVGVGKTGNGRGGGRLRNRPNPSQGNNNCLGLLEDGRTTSAITEVHHDNRFDLDRENAHDTVTLKLMLQHNMLLTLPFEIVKFSKLRSLDLSNNNLSHVNDFLLQLPELQTLYLHNNSLAEDGLPKDLPMLTKLRELNLSGNQLTLVPPQLYEMSGLKYLYLGNNQITEVLPEIKSMQR